MTNNTDDPTDPKRDLPLAYPIGPGEPVDETERQREDDVTPLTLDDLQDAPTSGPAYPIGPGESVTGGFDRPLSTEPRGPVGPLKKRPSRIPWRFIASIMVIAAIGAVGIIGWQRFGQFLNEAKPVDDLSAVLAMNPGELENLDRASPEFQTSHPLGRLYGQFKKDQLSDDDRRSLARWASQTANVVKNPKIVAVLDDIASSDSIVPAAVIVAPVVDPTPDPSAPESPPAASGSTSDSASAELTWVDELVATISFFRPGMPALSLTSWLQPGASPIPTDNSPPASLDARKRELWLLQVDNLKDQDAQVRARAAVKLANMCDAEKDPRAAGYLRLAQELTVGKPLGSNEARQLSDLNLKMSVEQLKQRLDQAQLAAGIAAQAANRKAQDALDSASDATKAANDASLKAERAQERADTLAGLIALSPAQLKEWRDETVKVIATLKTDELPKGLPDEQRTALAERVANANEFQKQLDDLAKLPELTEQQMADARRTLQQLQSKLIGLSADFAIARAAAGPPALWDREKLSTLLTQLETWTSELPPKAISNAKLTELRKEVADLKADLGKPADASGQSGEMFVTRLMQLMHNVTEFRVAGMYQQITARGATPLDGAVEVWAELQLTEERLNKLKPTTSSASLDASWQKLKQLTPRIDELLQRRDSLTDAERSMVVARVGQVSHIVSLLETTPLVVATPGPGTPGRSPPPPAVDLRPIQTAIAQVQRDLQSLAAMPGQLRQLETRLGKFESDNASQVATITKRLADLQKSGDMIGADVTGLQTRVGTVQAEIEQLRTTPPQLTAEQVAALVQKSVDQTLVELAKRGYVPANGGGPPPIPEPNPDLARVFAGNAFTEYFAGCPDQLTRAVDLFGKAVQYDPRSPTYRYFLGLTLYRLGRVREAEAQIKAGREWERQRAALRVDRELIRVQGDLRQWLDRIRHGV